MKIKSLLACGLASCMAMGLSSCFFGGSSDQPVEMYPVKVSNSAWSFVDNKGNIVYEDEFKNAPTPVIEGHFIVYEGESYTVYKADKKPKAIAEGLISAGYFFDGVIPVVKPKERISFMNGSGKIIKTLEPVNGKEIVKVSSASNDGMFRIVNADREIGYANTKGDVVIAPKYVDGTFFNEGYAIVTKELDDNEYSYVIINKKGKEEAKLKSGWTPESNFLGGRMLVSDEDGRYAFANTKGEVEKRLPEKVERVADYNEKYMIYENEDSYGLWKFGEDQPEIKAKYDYLSFYKDNLLLAYNDNKYFLVDYSGEKKVEFDDYKSIARLNGKGFEFMAREGSHYVLINEEGKPVGKEEFKDFFANIDFSDWVESDYFNVEGMVQQLVAGITANGYDKYSIGDYATKFNLTPEDHKWTSQLYLDNIEGYRYTISPVVYFNNNIIDYTYTYNGYYYGGNYNYFINPNSKIVGITLTVNAATDIWKDAKTPIIDALKEKGFKVDKTEENGSVTLLKGSIRAYVLGEDNQVAIALDAATYDEAPAVAETAASDDIEVGEVMVDEEY